MPVTSLLTVGCRSAGKRVRAFDRAVLIALEILRVRAQRERLGPSRVDRVFDALHLVNGEVVHTDHVAGLRLRTQALLVAYQRVGTFKRRPIVTAGQGLDAVARTLEAVASVGEVTAGDARDFSHPLRGGRVGRGDRPRDCDQWPRFWHRT